MLRPLALAGLSTVLLAGCVSLDPTYHRPAASVARQWPTGPAYGEGLAGAPDAGATGTVAEIGWRDFFADAKLKAVIEQALAQNRDLRIAVADVAEARAQASAQRAALFPTIDATASGTSARIPLSTISAASGGGAQGGGRAYYNERLYSADLGFSAYQLDLFGRVRSLSRSAQEQYLASQEGRRAAQISLVAQVAAQYLTLGADRALLSLAQQTETSGQNYLDLTQSRFKAGVASLLDVRQAQTTVEQARADQARDLTAVAQDRNALELLVGAPVADDLLPGDVDDQVTTLSQLPVGLSSDVLLTRPDVVQAEHLLRAQNAQIGAARAAFFPSISLTGSGGVSSDALSQLFTGASKAWSFAPTVTLPIFTGGLNTANLRYAKAAHDVQLAQYQKTVQTAFREVADALARRGTVDQQLAAEQTLVDAAADSLRLSQALYEHGSGSYLDVLTAQVALYNARQGLISTRLARADNLVTLYNVLGGGLDRPRAFPDQTGPSDQDKKAPNHKFGA